MAKVERFDFKKLDVYRASVRHFGWVVEVTVELPWRYRRLTDQMVSAALSVVGNLAEAAGRRKKPAESSQHFRYALGSTHECASYLDALAVLGRIDDAAYNEREEELARIGSMLTKLIARQDRRGRSAATDEDPAPPPIAVRPAVD